MTKQSTSIDDVPALCREVIAHKTPDTSPLIAQIVSIVDDTVHARVAFDKSAELHDRLFDLLMTRFEVLSPYKRDVCAVADAVRRTPELAHAMLKAQAASVTKTLTTAGIKKPSKIATIVILGIYNAAFLEWSRDTTSGLERTMSCLNKLLVQCRIKHILETL